MEWDSCDTLLKHGIWTVVFSIPDGYLVFTRPTVFCDGSWDYNSGRDTAHSTKDENCLTHLYIYFLNNISQEHLLLISKIVLYLLSNGGFSK